MDPENTHDLKILKIYIYIYIRERERENGRKSPKIKQDDLNIELQGTITYRLMRGGKEN